MELIDPWKGTTQAAQTLAALGQQIQQDKHNEQAQQMAALQMKQLQAANMEKEATDTALIDTYGTGDRGDRTAQLAAAKSFKTQKEQMDTDLKADQATVKEIFDLAAKVKEKGLGPDAVTPLIQGYASQLKSPQLRQLYGNLKLTDGWGAKTTVMLNGNEGYTHPITGQPLPPGTYEMEFDQNQKPTKVNLVKTADVEFFKNADGLPIATGNKHTGTVKTLADVVPPNQYRDATGTSGFQSAIGGLLDQSKAGSLYQLGNTGLRTGYAPFAEVEKDIRMAGGDYKVKPDEIDKAIDNARSTYKDTYVQGKNQKVGKSYFTPEYNLLGQQKDVSKGTEVTVHTGDNEKDYRRQSYQLQKEIRGDKFINQADDSNQKLKAMKAAYAEGKKSGNYTGADQAIGYYVNKLFDPDSVVMVSEFQRVAQSQGVPDKIVGSLQSLAGGGIKLTDKSRDALIRTVETINGTTQTRKAERLRQYRMDAVSLGLDPDKILAGRDGIAPQVANNGGKTIKKIGKYHVEVH